MRPDEVYVVIKPGKSGVLRRLDGSSKRFLPNKKYITVYVPSVGKMGIMEFGKFRSGVTIPLDFDPLVLWDS